MAAHARWSAAPAPPVGMSAPGLTAAICTRDRPAQLQRALASLRRLVPHAHEILVVDNAPPDDAARQVAHAHGQAVRYLLEPDSGLDIARNRALAAASCPVLAFLDDDAVAEPGWAGALAHAFQDPRLGAATGRVEALTLETPAQALFERAGGFGRGAQPIVLPRDARRRLHGVPAPLIAWAVSIGSGCSMAVRTASARALGGFDEALDRGATLPGGGDLDMLWRLLVAGHHVAYVPDALALHEHRRDLAGVSAQLAGHQRALIAWLSKAARDARGTARWPILAFLAWRLVKPGVRLARRAAGADPLPAAMLARMWSASWRGLISYRAAEAASRRKGLSSA